MGECPVKAEPGVVEGCHPALVHDAAGQALAQLRDREQGHAAPAARDA